MINKTNDIAQKPKNWIDQKGREINDGFIHLGNEIGMMWAKFKHNIEKQVADWIQWLKDLAMKYGIYALAGIGALSGCRPVPKGCHLVSGNPAKSWTSGSSYQNVVCDVGSR